MRAAIGRLADFGWAIFTSQNAVSVFWDSLRDAGLDARALAGVKLAAIGPATAGALLDHGLGVDVAPDRFVAEALLDALRDRRDVRGARVLYVAAEGARETLEEGLKEFGASVERIEAYRSVPDGAGAEHLRTQLEQGDVDLITFTSASSVKNFVAAVGADAATSAAAASIGPITSEAARDAGLDVIIEAADSTIPELVKAIEAHYA